MQNKYEDAIDRISVQLLDKYEEPGLVVDKVALLQLYKKYNQDPELTIYRITRNKKHYKSMIFENVKAKKKPTKKAKGSFK
mmetsp:Transcript_58703/g.81435  ORF Transcript_58703/g.81435 Transcript_58703/m.81435 type:complete len:81 (+) Transcript_58703:660-902(+)